MKLVVLNPFRVHSCFVSSLSMIIYLFNSSDKLRPYFPLVLSPLCLTLVVPVAQTCNQKIVSNLTDEFYNPSHTFSNLPLKLLYRIRFFFTIFNYVFAYFRLLFLLEVNLCFPFFVGKNGF